MFYVTQFESDPTKSFTQTAFSNIKSLQSRRVNFELRPLSFVLNWNNKPSWFLDKDRDYFTQTKPSENPIAIVHLQISDLLKVQYRSKNNSIGFTAIEASQVPSWICEGLNESYKGMIVPSEHCKKVLERSGLKIPVRVTPHALPDMWRKSYSPLPEKDPNQYTFGFVGNWNSRKNPITLLNAYIKAFPEPSDSTALLLKTYKAGDIDSYVKRIAGRDRPDIWIYDDSWTEQQLLWVFNMIDCYVSPHRGEGFGLTLAQTAALGKPCIYTGYSAPTEWLTGEGHTQIPHTLVKVESTLDPKDFQFERMKSPSLEWADVAEEDLTSLLRKAAEDRSVQGFSGQDLTAFRNKLSWESVGDSLIQNIEDIFDRKMEYLP